MVITEQLYKRIIAFLRQVANDCTTCLRRCDANCEHCRAQWANSIITDIEAGSGLPRGEADRSLGARVERILKILRNSSRPLRAEEIDISDLSSPQLKLWTLKYLVGRGIVSREFDKRRGRKTYYKYHIKAKKRTSK